MKLEVSEFKSIPTTPASFLIDEYHSRRILFELGYSTPLDELDDFTAQAFLKINQEYAKAEAEKMKKLSKKKGRK